MFSSINVRCSWYSLDFRPDRGALKIKDYRSYRSVWEIYSQMSVKLDAFLS
jgi:hypothetical protein